ARAQNLVQNPGFETGDLTHWSLNPGGPFDYVCQAGSTIGAATCIVHSGNYAMSFGLYGATDTLSQTITTVAGTYYTLSFWLANDNPQDQGITTFAVQWNDAVNMTTSTVYSLPSPQPSFPYTQVVITVLATSNSMTLAFVAEQDPSQWFLDDVSVVASTTAVKVDSFSAFPEAGGNLIEVKTGRDVNNLGFNLYRDDNGQRVKLNASLLAGTAFMAGAGTTFTAGQAHHWRDVGAGAGAVYWLEEVDLSGTRTWYGPAISSATESAPAAASAGAVQTLRAKSAPTGRANAPASPDTIALSSVGSVTGTPSAGTGSGTGTGSGSGPGPAPAAPSPQAIAQQYALAAGAAVRLDVQSEGWYRVTQPQLVAAGISPSVNPKNLQLYVNGVQQPIYVEGESNGKFDPQDAVDFYGLGVDTIWSGTQSYWLVAGAAKGLRMSIGGLSSGSATAGAASFPSTVDWKPRTIYFTALLNGDGNNFFGPVITDTPVVQPITVTHLYPAGGASKLQVTLQGGAAGPHSVAVSLNGIALGNVKFNDLANFTTTFAVSSVAEGANVLTLTASSPEDVSVVDDVQLTYPHSYTADGDYLRFTAPSGRATKISGFSGASVIAIDITDASNPSLVTGTMSGSAPNYALTIVPTAGTGTRTLLAMTSAQFLTPTVTVNHPSSWHSAQAGHDMVIIAHASLLASAGPLAALRQSQGHSVAVIDVQDLYDEFNFGVKSPYALKTFLATANANWTRKPHFVLLLGNGTFDPRNYMGTTVPDLVPVKLVDTQLLETASDDWFVDFNNDGIPDAAIGRLPAESAAEANVMIGRIVAYDASGGGGWNSEVLLVTGRNQDPGDNFANMSASIQALLPRNLIVNQLVQSTDPSPNDDLLAYINAGQSLVNYVGHGSNEVWAGGLFDSIDVPELTNGTRAALFLSMTCLNGFFQDLFTNPLGKALLNGSNGGAVAVWASSGLTDASPQSGLNQAMVKALYGSKPMTIGEAAAAAKAATTDIDVRRTWNLLGDPATYLH
ncbi:MAG TPA: C25 family cysteine peptidase, partial [Casimicrobiaceae bacterium]|nr:C25 family cysteine peptidase [Casimicrobiaceae bacterium]